jgi:outer membrane immunogenic protein
MRKLPVLAGVAVLFAGPAFAADVATKPVSKEPVFNWSGFYLGGYAGYAAGSADTTGTLDPNNQFGNAAPPAAQPAYNANMSPGLKPRGFTGGGTVGANWQKGILVWGLEGDFGAFALSSSATTSVTPPGHVNLTSSTSVSADWLGTARGRVGLAFDHSLFYATAGAAFTDLSFRQTNTYATGLPGGVESFSISNLRVGVAAGAGWEYMFLPDWSGKIEYLHLDFGTLTGGGVLEVQRVDVAHTTTFTADVVRAGVNYRFVTW